MRARSTGFQTSHIADFQVGQAGEDRIKKIVSQALALLFIKCAPGSQIIASGRASSQTLTLIYF
jgi:hypothetical protein